MHIYHKQDVEMPVEMEEGEVIYPLFGAEVDDAAEKHSLAYVVIPPSKSSSFHYHVEAEESYYILKGEGHLMVGDEQRTVGAGDTILIPPRRAHQIRSSGEADLEFLVVSVPPWRETDVVVLEKDGLS